MNRLLSLQIVQWLWLAWILYWFGSAFRVRRTVHREPIAQRMGTIAIMLVVAVLLGFAGWRLGILDQRFVADRETVQWTGLALTVAGLAITVWARIHLGQFWSARVGLKEDHQLIQSGPYAWVRHPIYTGILLAMAGTALAVGMWRALLALALAWVGFILKSRREERLLSEKFGSEYMQYQRRTGALVPRVFGPVAG